MTIAPGTRFGRYEILQELGRGAMGVVYQARDPQIDRLIAIKTISLDSQDPDDAAAFRERFFQEAKAAGRLSHPGIVQIYDVGVEPVPGLPYIVMEFVAGQSLNRAIHSAGGKLPLEVALALAEQIAEALAHAHSQGVVHRDIKPSNILITEDGRAKVTDFGVARLDRSTMTLPGELLGTPSYMAPEQLTGGPVDGRADLFSLGVLLYLMLSGHKPFQGSGNSTIRYKVVHRHPVPVSALDLDISPELGAVVRRAMEKDPAKRYQTGTEMALAFQRLHDLREVPPGPSIVPSEDKDVPPSTSLGFSSAFASAMTLRPVVIDPTPVVAISQSPSTAANSVGLRRQTRRTARVLVVAAGVAALMITGYAAINMRQPRNSASTLPTAATTPALATAAAETVRGMPPTAKASSAAPELVAKVSRSTPQHLNDNERQATSQKRPTEQAPGRPESSKPIAKSGAALSLNVDYPFDEAEVDVWVDNHLAYKPGVAIRSK